MEVQFSIKTIPQGKQRPVFSRHGSRVVTYTPEKTVSYEQLIKAEYVRQCKGIFFDKEQAVEILIAAYFPVPASASAKRESDMLNRNLYPTKKPDCDNIAKAVCDALNGVAYYDDKQIVRLTVLKFYAEQPEVKVYIKNIT